MSVNEEDGTGRIIAEPDVDEVGISEVGKFCVP